MIFAPQQLAQWRSSHKLHHDVRRGVYVVSFTEVVNGDDVWMAQHRSSACFSPETRECGIVFDELAREDLHRYVVADMYATRAVDYTHAAFAQLRNELILAIDLVSDEWIG